MSRSRIVIEIHDKQVKVRGWRAADLLRETGARPAFAAGGWWIPLKRLPDFIAHLEWQNIGWREQEVDA